MGTSGSLRGPLGARVSQVGAQTVEIGFQMDQHGHKWVNLGSNR